MDRKACAYVKSADMNTEYFLRVDQVQYLLKTTDGDKSEFYMCVSSEDGVVPITETDYNDLLQMMKG